MTSAARTAVLAVLQTLLLTGVLLWLRPVGALNRAIDWLAGLEPEAAMTIPVRRNAALHETSLGDAPRPSFEQLGARWGAATAAGKARLLFIGNSQMQMAVLAPGERLASQPEPTYFDWVSESLEPRGALCYRLSAGALSYTEALWYLTYLTQRPETTPRTVIVQSNYNAFSNGGLRDGITTLLEDGAFRAHIEALPASSPLYEAGSEALARHAKRQEQSGQAAQTATEPPAAAGHRLETATREALDGALPGLRVRELHKVDVYSLLFRARVHLFRIRSGGARSLAPARRDASRAALEALAALCRDKNIRLIVFRAPVNPRVHLFRTEADRTGYEDFFAQLEKTYGVPVLNFESGVPEAEWGSGVDGPDPLHLGRAGHRRFGGLLSAELVKRLSL